MDDGGDIPLPVRLRSPLAGSPLGPRTPKHTRHQSLPGYSYVNMVNMEATAFTAEPHSTSFVEPEPHGAPEADEKQGRPRRARCLLVAGWVSSAALLLALLAVLAVQLPAFLRSRGAAGKPEGGLGGDGATGETPHIGGGIEGGKGPMKGDIDVCYEGRIRSLHGSGPAICYQGKSNEIGSPEGPLPGDGSCAFCTGSGRDAAACIACQEGFHLDVADAARCSGRCIPVTEQQSQRPEDVCTFRPDIGQCVAHGDPILCYDQRAYCMEQLAWDDTMCAGPLGRWCQASCGFCSEPSVDSNVMQILLAWKAALDVGVSSPMRWGWKADIPLETWPGVDLEQASAGAFLKEL